jgi:hypothetical protein
MEIKKWMYWFIPVISAAVQIVAALVDYDSWIKTLPDQTLIIAVASCIVLPFLVVSFFAGWLLMIGLKFEQQARVKLLLSSIKAKILFYGTAIGLFAIFSVLGGMITWNTDFYWGIISFSIILAVPPALSVTYEYQEFRKLLPDVPKSRIAAYIAATFAMTVLLVVMLAIVILPVLFLCISLTATV